MERPRIIVRYEHEYRAFQAYFTSIKLSYFIRFYQHEIASLCLFIYLAIYYILITHRQPSQNTRATVNIHFQTHTIHTPTNTRRLIFSDKSEAKNAQKNAKINQMLEANFAQKYLNAKDYFCVFYKRFDWLFVSKVMCV